MDILIFEVIGVVLIFIVWFVHKHTYIRDYRATKNWGKFIKVKFPTSVLTFYIIFGLIPKVNIVCFVLLAARYIFKYIDEEGEFIFSFKDVTGQPYEYKPFKTINKIKKLFSRDLNR